MGREVECTARIAGKAAKGKALLETKELIFRGEARLKIPFAEIKGLRAAGGTLHVTWSGGEASFPLGADAETWAEKIRNPPSRLDKLGVKPGLALAVVGPLEEAFVAEARARGADLRKGARAGDGVDLLFFAVEARADLGRLAALSQALQPAGALWVVRRKGQGAPVTEAESMAAGKAAGLVDTKVVGFSETHTAERYVIPVAARSPAAKVANAAKLAKVATPAKPPVKPAKRATPAKRRARG
jgi:hypothetical protein